MRYTDAFIIGSNVATSPERIVASGRSILPKSCSLSMKLRENVVGVK